jgi:uncharacterized protein
MFGLILALVTAITVPPKPAAYVTDKAGVLEPARVKAVNEKLAQFERDTSNQVLVFVDRKLPPDETIEQFANEAMHQWGVGQKGKDNGAVLFLFTDDRKMRIEVGYGLEAVLTDAKAKRITSTIIKPRLQASDYNGAVEQGAEAILVTARGEENKGTGKTVHETGSRPAAAVPSSSRGDTYLPCGVFILIAGIALVGILIPLVRRARRGSTGIRTLGPTSNTFPPATGGTFSDASSTSSSDFSSSSSDSGSSDSGFDGGGGDSGGGGASDSW